MEIVTLDEYNVKQYDEFLLKNTKTLFSASSRYKTLLKHYLKCKDHYFLALQEGCIVGAFPCFIKENSKYGNVLNSLPYYGSSGAIIEFENNIEVKSALLSAIERLCKEKDCVASTIVTSPFEENFSFYHEARYDFTDSRRGLINKIPVFSEEIENNLMQQFNSMRRRNIRKAQKYNLIVRIDNSEASLRFLYDTHVDTMLRNGGKPKERHFFELVTNLLTPGVDYDIYISEYEGKRVSALLVFYFNKTVEYFTPVINLEYSVYNPLCLILLEVMIKASEKGYEYFNWGGTGADSQDSLYKFKKNFGAFDYPYNYFTRIYDKSILSMSRETILKEYPDFFVFPFGQV